MKKINNLSITQKTKTKYNMNYYINKYHII